MRERLYLSVVVPTYNRKDLLRITLEALGHQTYPRDQYEVIVVSDGSSDGTDEMVAEYAQEAPFSLRLIRQANSGVARTRNRGIHEATGEVLVFLDDDIEVVPEFLALHAVRHQQDEQVAVVGYLAPDPQRRHTEPPWIAWEHAMLERNYRRWLPGGPLGPGPEHFYTGNASVRRAPVLRIGGFDESLKRQEDTELAYRLQHICSIHFAFEARAIGLHRSFRSFASWSSMAYGYGRLDVAGARTGSVPWDRVRDFYWTWTRATRFLGGLILSCPVAAQPVRRLLLAGAQLCFKMRFARLSLAALSVLYNLRYLEGARAELGSHAELRRLLGGHDPDGRPELAECREPVGRSLREDGAHREVHHSRFDSASP